MFLFVPFLTKWRDTKIWSFKHLTNISFFDVRHLHAICIQRKQQNDDSKVFFFLVWFISGIIFVFLASSSVNRLLKLAWRKQIRLDGVFNIMNFTRRISKYFSKTQIDQTICSNDVKRQQYECFRFSKYRM